MRFISTLMAIVAAIMLSVLPVTAAEKHTVPANKTTGITFIYYATNSAYNCQSSGRGKYRIKRDAEHGTVRLEWRKLKAPFKNGCKDRTMNGLAVYYTPHKGYRGDDAFTVQLTVPGLLPGNAFNSGRSWSFKIDVK